MNFAAKGPPRGESADGPGNLSCLEGIDSSAIAPRTAPSQDQNQRNHNSASIAADITCAAMRRVELLARLGGLLEIVAVNAEAAALSLRIADDRGGRYHFNEAWDSIQEADRGFAELRALSGSHKEPSR